MAKNMKITQGQLYTLGHDIADGADNFLAAASLPLPTDMKMDALQTGLEEIRDRARKLYIEISGINPWEECPSPETVK